VNKHRLEFPGTDFAPLELPDRASLPLHLTVQNSPVLFGCRSGLCGTCLIEVEPLGNETLAPPDAAEAEALALYAPDHPRARLACQIVLTAGLRIVRLSQ
jgi:ferredoxin